MRKNFSNIGSDEKNTIDEIIYDALETKIESILNNMPVFFIVYKYDPECDETEQLYMPKENANGYTVPVQCPITSCVFTLKEDAQAFIVRRKNRSDYTIIRGSADFVIFEDGRCIAENIRPNTKSVVLD